MPEAVWLLWDCSDLVGVYDSPETAEEARALRLGLSPDDFFVRSFTVTRVEVRTDPRAHLRAG